MAFDLVQYFVEQIENQKPTLFQQHSRIERREKIIEFNALSLGKLISQWRLQSKETFQEIINPDDLYIQEIARHLTTSPHNQSQLLKTEQLHAISEILKLQLQELKQLNETAQLNHQGVHELLIGQIEYLSGQAEDWVWLTNNLTELKGSKPIIEETVSLEASLKEFHDMVSQQQDIPEDVMLDTPTTPTWAKILEPVVAIAILWLLANAACKLFA